jgi:cytochrome P450
MEVLMRREIAAQSIIPNVHSLLSEPTMTEHNRRRRTWDPAFSIKALSDFEKVVRRISNQLISSVGEMSQNKSIDLGEVMMWFGFDVSCKVPIEGVLS